MTGLLLAFVLGAVGARAQTTMSGDATVGGNLGVGTEIPWAHLHVSMSSTDAYGLVVSSGDGRLLFAVDKAGRSLVGAASPQARLAVGGSADDGDVGLLLRAGGGAADPQGVQMSWVYDSTATYGHSLRTRSSTAAWAGNGLDFYLWRTTAQPASLGTDRVLSLETATSVSSGSLHVVPCAQTPDAEVEVSNGVTLGGGIVRYGSSGPPSSRTLKSDVVFLGAEAKARAVEDIKAMDIVSFSYRGDPSHRTMRGVLFEEAPASVRGGGGVIVLDERLLNLELALQAVNERIAALEAVAASRKARDRR